MVSPTTGHGNQEHGRRGGSEKCSAVLRTMKWKCKKTKGIPQSQFHLLTQTLANGGAVLVLKFRVQESLWKIAC